MTWWRPSPDPHLVLTWAPDLALFHPPGSDAEAAIGETHCVGATNAAGGGHRTERLSL